jgi:hypothetical protein
MTCTPGCRREKEKQRKEAGTSEADKRTQENRRFDRE